MIPAKRVDFPICETERDNHRQHVVTKVRRRQLPVMRTTRQQKLPVEEFCIRCIACKLKDAAPTACRDESLASFANACAIPRKSSVLAEKVVTQLLAYPGQEFVVLVDPRGFCAVASTSAPTSVGSTLSFHVSEGKDGQTFGSEPGENRTKNAARIALSMGHTVPAQRSRSVS